MPQDGSTATSWGPNVLVIARQLPVLCRELATSLPKVSGFAMTALRGVSGLALTA